MFDGVAPIPQAKKAICEGEVRLHVCLVVEVSKGSDLDSVLVFVCSAWPESIEVQKVFPIRKKAVRVQSYMGRNFNSVKKVEDVMPIAIGLERKELEAELQAPIIQIAFENRAFIFDLVKLY